MSIRNLEPFFAPRKIALIGASDRPSSVGATVWHNLRTGGFGGEIIPVNPVRERLDGVAVLRDVSQLPGDVDLAVVCTPAPTVPGVVAALARAGVRAAIVISAGLDATQRQAMLDAARPTTMRILGPNCLGVIAPHAGLNASFAHAMAPKGSLAFITQSGAIGTAVLDWARSRQLGLSCMVSLGDHADVDFGDLLDLLATDAQTRAILLYVESIQSARKFMSAARAAARNKPVFVIKAGRAGQGVAAAHSHTGAMSGADVVYDAAIRRAGMVRVDTLAQLLDAAESLGRLAGSPDAALTILTNGGGAGVMAADCAALRLVPMATLAPETQARLDAELPANWSHGNPVDIIGDAPVERYTTALRTLLDDRATGTILLMHSPTAIVPSEAIARACLPLAQSAGSRVISCWLGADAVAGARRLFAEGGIADFATPEDAIEALDLQRRYRRGQALLDEVPSASELTPADLPRVRDLVASALGAHRLKLDAATSKAVLGALGIPVAASRRVAARPEDAAAAASSMGYPVVLKIASEDISHKSDVGGVVLRLASPQAVEAAARDMLAHVRKVRPEARLEGFDVEPMIDRPNAFELIVGASIDPTFGPVLLFGQGGTSVEIVGDRALALPPLNRALAAELLSRTKIARLLAGYRDRPPAAIDAIYDILVRVSDLLAEIPEIAELDINPLLADEHGVLAIDARIRLDPARPAGSEHFAIRPYPRELAETVLWQGRFVEIRPIKPEDAALHAQFMSTFSPQDMRLRFFSTRRELPRSEAARLVQIDYAREMAFVAIDIGAAGGPSILGDVRAVSDPDNVEAEFAIMLRPSARSGGLGELLLRKLVATLKAGGTRRLVADVLADNRPMCSLAHRLSMKPRHGAFEDGVLHYELDLQDRKSTT